MATESLIRHFCERLALENSLPFERSASATVLTIARDNGLNFVLTVPDSVLEWFADGYVADKRVWSDWADYYEVENESEEQLAANMRDDLREAVPRFARLVVRVHEGRVEQWENSRWIVMSIMPNVL